MNDLIPIPVRNEKGHYEEDCMASVVYFYLKDKIIKWLDKFERDRMYSIGVEDFYKKYGDSLPKTILRYCI